MKLNLASLASVRTFAEEFNRSKTKLFFVIKIYWDGRGGVTEQFA